jgi:hypothetical protein
VALCMRDDLGPFVVERRGRLIEAPGHKNDAASASTSIGAACATVGLMLSRYTARARSLLPRANSKSAECHDRWQCS